MVLQLCTIQWQVKVKNRISPNVTMIREGNDCNTYHFKHYEEEKTKYMFYRIGSPFARLSSVATRRLGRRTPAVGVGAKG